MKFKHLLAKNAKDPENPRSEETLVGHTEAVVNAAMVLNDVIGNEIIAILGDQFSEKLWRDALFCSAWLHDIGKANDHFQNMIRNSSFRQGIRHETLGIVVINQIISSWIRKFWLQNGSPKWLWPAILYAVSGHHLKFPDSKERGGIEVHFLGAHQEIKPLLDIGRKQFALDDVPYIRNRKYLLTFGGIDENLDDLMKELDLDFTPHVKLFIAVLKSILMCSDIGGSALPGKIEDKEQNIQEWLKQRIAPVLEKEQLEDVVRKKLKGSPPRIFQQQVINSECNTILVEAGCGSGKTAAAYLWASRHADGKRLFFCYPTTTTASEGFSGYLQHPDFEAILVNSRANVDYRLLDNLPPRTKSQIEFRNLRLEALETWPIPAVVCTAHAVLGILQNARRGIFALPSIVRSVFVFDEIHSYSSRLFQHLLRFLEIFSNVPVLLMTATLPPDREKALKEVCKNRGGLNKIKGPSERENAKRYILQDSGEETSWQKAKEVLNDNGKVLWVCNTVERAMKIIDKAYDEGLPVSVQPFHSRYRYKDRLVRQREVIDGFLPGKPRMLAVTTQVAEMSLDISADLLVSEYAPVASLIQRLGRLNRFEDNPSEAKIGLLIKPPNALPYAKKNEEAELWEKVEDWLSIVCDGKPKSQRELSEAFVLAEQKNSIMDATLLCDWIDDPWTSLRNRKSLMEPAYTIDVIRQEDLASGHLDELVMPMPFPKGSAWQNWDRKGRYFIAPAGTIDYSLLRGGKYAKESPEVWII